jgi:hypothetical protein
LQKIGKKAFFALHRFDKREHFKSLIGGPKNEKTEILLFSEKIKILIFFGKNILLLRSLSGLFPCDLVSEDKNFGRRFSES